MTGTGNGIWYTGFFAVAANACRTAHLTLHRMASVYLSAVRGKNPSVQTGQSGSEERSFPLRSHVVMWAAPTNLTRRQKGRKWVSAILRMWFSKWGPWIGSIAITWELVRNANSQPHPRPIESVGEGRGESPVI